MAKKKKVTKTGHKKFSKAKRCLLLTICIVVTVGVAAVVWGVIAAHSEFDQESSITLIIPQESTDAAIGDSLKTRLGDDFGPTVYRLWALRGGEPQKASGIYVVSPGDKAWSVAGRIKSGSSSPVRVTFNNIRLMSDLAERISSKFLWSSDDFLKACDAVLPTYGFSYNQYPAAFIPDTYEFYASATPEEVVEKLVGYRNRFWTDERRMEASTLGLTPVEVATLASIVEEESNSPEERPVIARLYLNRLDKGMKLQADPTVKYALGDFSIRRLYEKQLFTPSPYNTYYTNGLPPGPIRIPEISTVKAVLNAPANDYIYMCAKPGGEGTHNFTSDYKEHLRNARAYQSWLDSIKLQ